MSTCPLPRLPSLVLALLGAACKGPTPALRPAAVTTADAALLLAQLSGDGTVSITGSYGAELYVDVDGRGDALLGEDSRYAFRYRVYSGNEVLYSRSTSGPIIVRDFLDYYSGSVDIDILAAFPGLGEFPIVVPLLPDADRVGFEIRGEDGVYEEVGSYDLSRLEADDVGASSVVAGGATLHESGPPHNRLDVVLMGDGYTEAELDLWKADADAVAERLLDAEPFNRMAGLLNVHRVDAVSVESGVSFDCVDDDCRIKDTAFGTVFAIEAVNRMLGTSYRTSPVFQLEQWEVARAAATVPWDMVLIVANAEHSGGFAVHYATAPHHRDWENTAVHELGHTIGLLGDEYAVDDCVRSSSLGLPDNIAEDLDALPWSAWVEAGTPLPTPADGTWVDEIGAFSPAYNCDDLYRAASTCRMDDSDLEFCPICQELIVRRLLRYADPLDGVTVHDGGMIELESAFPELTADEQVQLRWTVDGVEQSGGWSLDAAGAETVEVEATLTTPLVREARGDLTEKWVFTRGK